MKRFSLILLFLIGAFFVTGSNSKAQETTEPMKDAARRASFIFSGTVHKNSASPDSAVVRVDEILRNAGVVSDVLGKEVMVLLDGPPLKEGEQVVFFTNVAIYGNQLTVREIGRASSEPNLAALQIRDVIKAAPDSELETRLAAADLVVLGKVSSVRARASRDRRVPSEHDPEWWQATVRIESVEKGAAASTTVLVLFPHSVDIRWFAAPKFKVGQEGVFLLQRTSDNNLQNIDLKATGFTALHPQDFQPTQALPKVKRLVLEMK